MSSLFSGPTSITPWIEQAVFDALVTPTNQQQQPNSHGQRRPAAAATAAAKLVQVVALGSVTISPNNNKNKNKTSGLIPSCMKISDGKTQILAALSPETRNELFTRMLPTRGCVVRISGNNNNNSWKVSCVSWLCQNEGFSTKDFQWEYNGRRLGIGGNQIQNQQQQQLNNSDDTTTTTTRNNNKNDKDALCLYVTGRVETLGGHGMAIAGNPVDVHAALDVRRALQSLTTAAAGGDADPAIILQKRLGLKKKKEIPSSSSSLDDDDDDDDNPEETSTAARTRRPPGNHNDHDDGANLPIGNVAALFDSYSQSGRQAALAGINAAAAGAAAAADTKKLLLLQAEQSQPPPPPPPPSPCAPKPAPPTTALVNGFSGLRLDGRGASSFVVTDPLQMKNLFGNILEAGKQQQQQQQKNSRNSSSAHVENDESNDDDDKMRRQRRTTTEHYGDSSSGVDTTIAAVSTFEKRLADLIASPNGTNDILDHLDSLADAAFLKWFENKIEESSRDPEKKFALQNLYDAIIAVKPKQKLDKERASKKRALLGDRDKRTLKPPPPSPPPPREEMPEGDEEDEEEEAEVLGIGDMLVSQDDDDEEEQVSGAVGMTVISEQQQQQDAELKEPPKDAPGVEPEVSEEKGGEREEETKYDVDEYVQGAMKARVEEKSDDESEEEEESEPGLETQCPLVFQGDDETEISSEIAESRKRPLADTRSDEGVASETGSEGLARPSGKKAVRELTMTRWLRIAGTAAPATVRKRERRGRLAGEGIRLWLASHTVSDD